MKELGLITWDAGETRTLQVLKPEYVVSEYEAAVKKKREDLQGGGKEARGV